jgi:hypothetical protein
MVGGVSQGVYFKVEQNRTNNNKNAKKFQQFFDLFV